MTTEWTTATDLPSAVGEVAELARRGTDPQEVQPGHIYLRTLPDGTHELVDLLDRQAHLPAPRRKRGTVTLADADSFAAYVTRHQTPATVLYANQDRAQVVAILNDHAADGAGWGDFRAVLQLALTKPWQHWAAKDGRLLPQTEFAEHIEQGLEEIVAPPAAEMLELAQHFEAHNRVEFKSVQVLADGRRSFRYEEQLEAKAGQAGTVQTPREFELGVPPYEGTGPWKVVARLRYRLNGGQLAIGYSLVRPEAVLRAAFGEALETITAATEAPILRGVYGG